MYGDNLQEGAASAPLTNLAKAHTFEFSYHCGTSDFRPRERVSAEIVNTNRRSGELWMLAPPGLISIDWGREQAVCKSSLIWISSDDTPVAAGIAELD